MRLKKDQVFIQSPKSILCPKSPSSLTPYYHKNLINLSSSKKISPVYYTVLDHLMDLLSHQKGINIYLYMHGYTPGIWFSPPTFIFQNLQERVYNNKMVTIVIVIKIKKKAGEKEPERQREGYIPKH